MQSRWIGPRWTPLLVVVLSLVGIALVPLTIGRDAASYDWLTGRVGGSGVYTLNLVFARAVPFIIAASIGIAVWQRLRGRSRDSIADGQVHRHDKTTVFAHWVNGLSMIACLITAMWFVRWFERPFEVETLYLLHFIFAALVLAMVAHHATFQMALGGDGLKPRGGKDFQMAAAETFGYAGVFSKQRSFLGLGMPLALRRPIQRFVVRTLGIRPGEEDKYLASERVLSYAIWTILIGVVVITGVLKSARYVMPIPDGALRAATFLHDGAMVWIIALLFIHVAAIVLIPLNLPLLKSMLTTRISLDYVSKHLPIWYRRLEAENPGLQSAVAPTESNRPATTVAGPSSSQQTATPNPGPAGV
ncbi:MAG: cytochrome b/b6 domain-containing protein [Dehalococcoidia bacterium]